MTGTEYLIDVAARLTGGDKTVGTLDDIAAKLTLSGDASNDFEAALQGVADKLAAAEAASAAANEKLREGTAQYSQLEKAADKAAQAAEKAAVKTGGMSLDQLTASVNTANTALTAGREKLRELQAAARAAGGVLKSEGANATDAMRVSAEQAAVAVASQAAAVKALSSSAKDAARNLQMFESVDKLRAQADAARVALDAEAKALSVLDAEAKAAAAGVTKLKNTQKTLADLQAKSRTHFQRQAESMGRLAEPLGRLGSLGRVGQSLLMTGKAASGVAASLGAARASMLLVGLGAAAAAAAVLALGVAFAVGVVSITKWGIALSEANRKADDLSFDKQSKQFQKNIKKTFGVLNIEPFLKALSRVVDLFDSGTKSGETMSFLFKSLFQPLVDALPKLLLWGEAFFLGLQIGALEVYIAFKPLIKQLKEFLGFDGQTTEDTFKKIAAAGKYVAYGLALAVTAMTALAVIVGVLVVAVGAIFVAALIAVTVVIGAVGAAIYGLWVIIKGVGEALGDLAFLFVQMGSKAWSAITDGVSKAVDYLRNTSLLDIGKDLIQGFVDGILSGFRLVADTMRNLSKLVLNTPAAELDIHSPSRAAREQARHVPEGYALGIRDGVPAVEDAASTMASGAVASPGGSAAATNAGVNLDGVTFNFYGVKDGQAAVTSLRQALLQMINGELEQAGAGYA